MKHTSLGLAAGLGLALLASTPVATASIYGPGDGYYYIAYSHTGNLPNPNQYIKVGPFAEEADCWAHWEEEKNDGDGWKPFVGSGLQCDWVFGSEVPAFDDALDAWNSIAGGGDPHVGFGVAELLKEIVQLQHGYQIERYKAEVAEVVGRER